VQYDERSTTTVSVELTLADLRQATGAKLVVGPGVGDPRELPLRRVAIDSRVVQPGDLFWALRGTQRDGAEFVEHAFTRGASLVVVARSDVEPPLGCAVLEVNDTRRALWQAARWQRARFGGRVVAVTGSVGKTTARQMIDTVLGSQFHGTASPANYNNELGVPLGMLAWRADDDYAVLELAATARGEIARLASLARPHDGVITRVGDAHLGRFGGLEAVADAKAELLDVLPSSGNAVLNGDDPAQRRRARRSRAPICWVGRRSDCELVATDVHSAPGRLSFTIEDTRFHVPVWGRHHLAAALAAVGVGREWGIPLREIAVALADFQPPPMRCEVMDIGRFRVINDAYNASPLAMRAALDLLRETETPGRRFVVCGDMHDLGPAAAVQHERLGREVVTIGGADVLVACGKHAEDVVRGARQAGMPSRHVLGFPEPDDAAREVGELCNEGDVVLIKGSRAARMERVVAMLRDTPERLAA